MLVREINAGRDAPTNKIIQYLVFFLCLPSSTYPLMKITSILSCFVVVLLFLMFTGMNRPKESTVRHVVVFKYKADASEDQIRIVTEAFASLEDKIPGIVGFEHGVNNSPEGLNQGFTHVYLLTFKDAATRDAYLPHPEHKKFGEVLMGSGIFEEAFVVDYTPQ